MNPLIARGRVRLLLDETRWLIRLRWYAGAIIVVLGLVDWRFQEEGTHGQVTTAVGVYVLFYNAVMTVVLKKRPSIGTSFGQLVNFASVQLMLDFVCLIVLTLRTGGVTSPVIFAFLPHMLFAALVQPLSRTLAISMLTIGSLAAGLWFSKQWPVGTAETLTALGWTGTLLLTIYLTHRVTHALYLLEEARVKQIERNEEMWTKLVSQQATLVQAEKMAAMGQMVAGIAHEITNPLASMDSVLQHMQRSPSTPKPTSVNTLRQQIQRILQIMRQFTTFSHPGRGVVQQVRLSDVIRSSLDMLAFNRSMRRVELVQRFQEHDDVLRLNPHAMQQVLTNMLINALDALADIESPRITIASSRRDDAWVIEISDNGVGIAPEHLPQIFDSFFTTKPVGKGTGLGLAICARLIREQGGKIDVSSTLGTGTTFTITLRPGEADAGTANGSATGTTSDTKKSVQEISS